MEVSGDVTLSIKGYNFIVNSVWPEIASAVQNNLTSIFAPGDPDAFHKVCTAGLFDMSTECYGSTGVIDQN